ncbi:unnamed protein product [Rotaria sp. Silwood1]|nr:unnamed protein product [Rotaria sp. Silwood1]CAF1678096.1 unnamed protein product [Rotaria sp. Silwood1]
MTNRTTQVIECLNKLYDLMPDGIITYEKLKYAMQNAAIHYGSPIITDINSLQKLESCIQSRERHTMTGLSSNEQSIDFGFNLIILSQDDGNVQNLSSSIADLTTALSSTLANKFLVFDTYKTCHHQLML